MTSNWTLRVAGRVILHGTDHLDDRFLTVFRSDDLVADFNRIEEYFNSDEPEDYPEDGFKNTYVFASTVLAIRERMALLGYTPELVYRRWRKSLATSLTTATGEISSYWKERGFTGAAGITKIMRLVVEWGQRECREYRLWAQSDDEEELSSLWEELIEESGDPRELLLILTRGKKSASSIELDVSDLIFEGWLDYDQDVIDLAQDRLREEATATGSVIVITEGVSDARLLEAAFRLARPWLAGYFTFLDFDGAKHGGGTDQVVRITKGLAAAGVVNRVLVVLDNDVAGRKAELELSKVRLPGRFHVLRLPDMDYLQDYPTLGPTGLAHSDVNGRSGSIELCFGKEILTRIGGEGPPPVRWKSFDPKLDAYQGEVSEKGEIQDFVLATLSDSPSVDLYSDLRVSAERLTSHLIDPLLRSR